ELSEAGDRRRVSIAGMITSLKIIYTKKGLPMCFMVVEDLTGEVEIVVFSDLYEKYQNEFQEDRIVLVNGETDFKEEEEVKLIGNEIVFLPQEPGQLLLKIRGERSRGDMETLKDILTSFPG